MSSFIASSYLWNQKAKIINTIWVYVVAVLLYVDITVVHVREKNVCMWKDKGLRASQRKNEADERIESTVKISAIYLENNYSYQLYIKSTVYQIAVKQAIVLYM